MKRKSILPEHQMMKFILGKWISKPIYIATKLGIADLLDKGSINIRTLSDSTKTHMASLYRLMRALSCIGIFSETKERYFINTPLSECLMTGRLKSASLMFHSKWHDTMWDNLLYSIKTGNSSFEKIHEEPVMKWFEKNLQEAKIFQEANAFKAAFIHRVIVDVYDFIKCKTITDVGGGIGGLMFEIIKKNPYIKRKIADLPSTIQRLKKEIKELHFEKHVECVECDFLKSIPKGNDAYILSHILHDWPDKLCITILKNCREVMNKNHKLLVIEGIIESGDDFSINKLLDLELLLMGGGRERRKKEFMKLFLKSGFKITNVIPTKENVSVIEGTSI